MEAAAVGRIVLEMYWLLQQVLLAAHEKGKMSE